MDGNIQELAEFEALAKKVASGKANKEEIKKMEALQIHLHLPVNDFDDRKVWLDKYEQQLQELQYLKKKLEKKLKS